jgi:hypothetical protein
MVRTQIQLTEEQVRSLRNLAEREHLSMAEVIRRCVDRVIIEQAPGRSERYARAAGLVGAFSAKGREKDLARRHDRYLQDAFD